MESCQEEKDRCYFVYGHYKSDTNELFYIGIGKKRSNIKGWEVKYDL